MSEKLLLAQNFRGMDFLNSPRVTQNDQLLKIENETVNANAIAVFMGFLLLAGTVVAYFVLGGSEAAFFLAVGSMAGGMFVGMLYLIVGRNRDRVLPYFDKRLELLVLSNGTQIAKRDVRCFRQFACYTKSSNFRLVLTTVVAGGVGGTLEYAVVAVNGTLSEDCIGSALANCLGVKLMQDGDRKFSRKEVAVLGLH